MKWAKNAETPFRISASLIAWLKYCGRFAQNYKKIYFENYKNLAAGFFS